MNHAEPAQAIPDQTEEISFTAWCAFIGEMQRLQRVYEMRPKGSVAFIVDPRPRT